MKSTWAKYQMLAKYDFAEQLTVSELAAQYPLKDLDEARSTIAGATAQMDDRFEIVTVVIALALFMFVLLGGWIVLVPAAGLVGWLVFVKLSVRKGRRLADRFSEAIRWRISHELEPPEKYRSGWIIMSKSGYYAFRARVDGPDLAFGATKLEVEEAASNWLATHPEWRADGTAGDLAP